MSSRPKRYDVVQEARRWIGTPYHPGAMVLGSGVDCATLLYAVFSSCGVIPEDCPIPKYSPSLAGMCKGERLYRGFVERFANKVDAKSVGIGDVILYKVQLGRKKSVLLTHGAIVTEIDWENRLPVSVVHAILRFGRVVETTPVPTPELSIESYWSPKVWWQHGVIQDKSSQ